MLIAISGYLRCTRGDIEHPVIGINWWDSRRGRGVMIRGPKPGYIVVLLAAILVVAVDW
jgi:hypothetical protein